MKLQFDGNQPFQLAAVQAVVDLFNGQPRSEPTSSPLRLQDYGVLFRGQVQSELGVGNHLILDEARLRQNTRVVQLRNDIEVADEQAPLSAWELFDLPANMTRRCPHFTVEMETGTGKTYVYLRTIRELSRRYGWRKFVIVVPSIAIREGVLKNLEVTQEHFGDLFDHEPCEFFVYSSKDLNRLRQFATANTLQVMVINIDSFRKDAEETGEGQTGTANVIYKQIDRMSGQRPIDFLQAARPIVVLDEPQSIDNTEKAQAAIHRLNPLCTLRYSATHRDEHNLVYRLDPVRAFDLKLVKQIVVASVGAEGGANAAFVRVEKVDHTKGIIAKVRIQVAGKDGPKEKLVTLKSGDDLFDKSGERECYRDGFKVVEINAEPGNEYVQLVGRRLRLGEETGGARPDVWRVQIKETVRRHLDKELQVLGRGIKVLSLFFIDKVANYRLHGEADPRGRFAVEIERILGEFAKDDRYRGLAWLHAQAASLHHGYFAQDKKSGPKDSKEGRDTKDDEAAYDLIMKDKERLLSVDEPLRFLFSHSALREGWDNPNVFQICTLNETQSTMKKRQEIGRGLRLPVDSTGHRVRDESINRLLVVANESYEEFARRLQGEYEADCGVTFGKVPVAAFAKLTTLDGDDEVPLGRDQARVLHAALIANGMLSADGKLQPAFDPRRDDFVLAMPPQFAHLRTAVIDILSAYQIERHVQPERQARQNRLRKEVQLGADFQELWQRIKARTTYRVEFDSGHLIKSAAEAVQAMPKIQPRTVLVKSGRITVKPGGVEPTPEGVREEEVAYRNFVLPDLLGYLQNATELTRSTLLQILQASKRLEDVFIDAQTFLDHAVTAIQAEMHRLLVSGIRYEKLAPGSPDSEWEMTKFADGELLDYLNSLPTDPGKSLYDYIEYESEVERAFAKALNDRADIRLFVKLPRWFVVDTPVGHYNPDWAIVKHDEATVYMVRETKGTRDFRKRRGIENDKVLCGERHFKALGVSFDVVTSGDDIR
ncbi:MAG: DEAD/DEAH box helicase family protein [Planctomycetes bacterium]|nr:DEAD/DEAH box helicase family protein [Planctomycetota bacterium]